LIIHPQLTMNKTSSHHSSSSNRHHEIVKEADSLIQRLAHSSLGEEAQALMSKLREAVDILRTTAEEAQEQVKSGVAATQHAVKRHPLTSVGIAAGAGFAVGLLTRHCCRKAA